VTKKPLHPSTLLYVVIFSTIFASIVVNTLGGMNAPSWVIIAVESAIAAAVLAFLIPRWPNSRRR